MKKLIFIIITSFLVLNMAYGQERNIYSFSPKLITGEEFQLSNYKGKVLLIVNTASRCGFTSQYSGLEEVYQKYKDKGFLVLGFPSNDFLGQEPGSNKEIQEFCKSKFNISFPMFDKNPVTGSNKQPLFKFLTEEGNKELTGGVKWNFEKFLISRKGELINRFGSFSTPAGTKITSAIESALAEELSQ